MARKRMIDPHFWESAADNKWKSEDCVVMMAAISVADDEGRGRIFNLIDTVKSIFGNKKINKSLSKLQNSVKIYNKIYYFLPNWNEYQKVSHPVPSKFPDPKLFINNDINSKSSGTSPETFRKHSGATPLQFKVGKYSLNKVSVGEDNLKNLNDLPPTSQPQFELPLLTDYEEYKPKTFDDHTHVRNRIENILKTFTHLELRKEDITRFFNIVMHTRGCSKPTAFKFLHQLCIEFKDLAQEKKNFAYLSKTLEGRIKDALNAALKKEDGAKNNNDSALNIVNDIVEKVNYK